MRSYKQVKVAYGQQASLRKQVPIQEKATDSHLVLSEWSASQPD